jgi:molecular chaperone GrpE
MTADKDKDKKKRDSSPEEPIVRDKRRIDPETGEARVNSESIQAAEEDADAAISDEELLQFLENAEKTADSSSEHLNDLKRVQAEYANYRKRVERDRSVARELAIAEVMTGILPILDDLDLAQAHGDLEGSSLDLIAQKIRMSFERYGLVQVGAVGEPFDPKLHEAIAQLPSKDVTSETIADVALPGYQLGERLLRAAKVAVSVPED